MKVPFKACIVIGVLVLGCALAGVILNVSCNVVGRWCLFPQNGNGFLAMALVAVAVITFFGFLAYGDEPEDMRTAIAVALVTVYLVLVSEVAFFVLQEDGSATLDPLTKRMITSFTAIIGKVIPFYFGESAYVQTRDSRTRRDEIERETDALRREVTDALRRELADLRAARSDRTRGTAGAPAEEGSGGQQDAT
jgi:hypothetical protein